MVALSSYQLPGRKQARGWGGGWPFHVTRVTHSFTACAQPLSSFFPGWFLSRRKLGTSIAQGNALRFGGCLFEEVLMVLNETGSPWGAEGSRWRKERLDGEAGRSWGCRAPRTGGIWSSGSSRVGGSFLSFPRWAALQGLRVRVPSRHSWGSLFCSSPASPSTACQSSCALACSPPSREFLSEPLEQRLVTPPITPVTPEALKLVRAEGRGVLLPCGLQVSQPEPAGSEAVTACQARSPSWLGDRRVPGCWAHFCSTCCMRSAEGWGRLRGKLGV